MKISSDKTDFSSVSVARGKSIARARRPFEARWWVAPNGYAWRSGLTPAEHLLRFEAHQGSPLLPRFLETDAYPFDQFFEDEPDAEKVGRLRWLVAVSSSPPLESMSNHYWISEDWPHKEYDPLRCFGIHREFASLELDELSIKNFAESYGFLGSCTTELRDENDRWIYGELLEDWQSNIMAMRIFIKLWDALRGGDKEVLEELVRIDTNVAFVDENLRWKLDEEHNFWMSTGLWGEYHFPHYLPHDDRQVSAARIVLRGQVNDYLSEYTTPAVDFGPGGQVSIQPSCLLGALYVHLAQEIMGRTEAPVRCAACGKWFFSQHASRIYCSDSCKFKSYRQRKKGEGSNG